MEALQYGLKHLNSVHERKLKYFFGGFREAEIQGNKSDFENS